MLTVSALNSKTLAVTDASGNVLYKLPTTAGEVGQVLTMGCTRIFGEFRETGIGPTGDVTFIV